jgi:hypothetical protein
MKHFYLTELPEEVIHTIRTSDMAQFGWHTDVTDVEQVIQSIQERVRQGTLGVSYHKDCVYLLTDSNPGIIFLDSLRGKRASIFNYIDGIKKLIEFLKDKTDIHKIITKTPFKELSRLQKKTGFTLEGTHTEEYLMPDGSYADIYSFGYILRRDKCLS